MINQVPIASYIMYVWGKPSYTPRILAHLVPAIYLYYRLLDLGI